MPSLSLPPRGVFVPTLLIYATDLSPAAFHTWVQLRGLGWQDRQTPPCSIQDLSKITGKSPSTLYGHLAVLKSRGLLRWRSAGRGILTIVFDLLDERADLQDDPSHGDPPGDQPETELDSRSRDSRIQDSGLQESGLSPSLNTLNLKIDANDGLRERGNLPDSGIQGFGNLEPNASKPTASNDPIAIYRALTGRRPNQTQRAALLRGVTDPELWRRTLAHWQVHGWNPTNLAGQLDLYQRGGPEACRYCASKHSSSQPDPIDELILELQKEIDHARPGRHRPDPEDPD